MLRRDLINGIQQILRAIETTGVTQLFRLPSEKVRADAVGTLRRLRDYTLVAQSFTPSARHVAATFKINVLEEPDTWMALLSNDSPVRLKVSRSISALQTEIPHLLSLLTQDSPNTDAATAEPAIGSSEPLELMRIALVEEHAQFSTVSRVIDALSACQELYDSLQKMSGESTLPLAIGPMDSGSDKSFDLFGAAALMKEFRELVVSIWGLVVFHREHKLGKRLELIASSLPILERVNQLEHSGKLGREEAQIIRNGITDGAKKFIAAGVITEDLASHSNHDPRALLAPEPRLLTGPQKTDGLAGLSTPSPSPSPRDSENRDDFSNVSALSDEDLDRLVDRMARRSRTDKSDGGVSDGDNDV